MNKAFEEYKGKIKNKKIAAVGLGISNRPLFKYFADLGMDITGFDSAPYEKLEAFIEKFKEYDNVSFHIGPQYLEKLKGYDIIFKTPAIRPDIEPFLDEIERGALLTSEMEVFMKMCPAKIIAVTGSDGKTTTTTVIGKILEKQGFKVWVGGNIGTPLFDKLDFIKSNDVVVLELGSFQLQTIRDKSPDIAVITNISPNHLDFHKKIEEYIWSKKNIYRYQKPDNILVLNKDNKTTKTFANEADADIIWFSRESVPEKGVFLQNGIIKYSDKNGIKELFSASEIAVRGIHNVENFMAAIAAVYEYVDVESIVHVARTFKGVEHRIEPVMKINDVWYYNDSIGSSPTRTKASLRAFEEKLILITGGYDKKISYDMMGPLIIERVKALILLGETGPKIKTAFENTKNKTGLGQEIPVKDVSTIDEAVEVASKMATPGDVVILSPASASYDMFPNFEVRGNVFKEAVKKLNK